MDYSQSAETGRRLQDTANEWPRLWMVPTFLYSFPPRVTLLVLEMIYRVYKEKLRTKRLIPENVLEGVRCGGRFAYSRYSC
ncbi:MAG: hypothetical protein KatS3mg115_1830 [Candidatus Poribacteria bacterium]|nr:MAG: hypothetical protein KatS3mg115_1830 [Candidatus Poribacteria bacterium]